jgi:dienelactone hydrolase
MPATELPMRAPLRFALPFLALMAGTALSRGGDLDVPWEKAGGIEPGRMLHQYLMRQVERTVQRSRSDYEARKTPPEIAAYQKRLREKFLDALGGLPEPTPLEPRITGVVRRPGYRVEKILFQSQPRHYVTALLFLPDPRRFSPKYPGVVIPCGHALKAKGHDAYQSMGALLALHGMAALVFDPIDQGERGQYFGPHGWPELWGTRAHSMVGVASILLGRNTARFEIWDGMRAIEYLQSRPEVDRQRIGCTGNSGGGTQTSYLMALDDRVRAAAPSCYLTSLRRLLETIGPQDAEQHLFGQLAFGADHADLVMMRAPTPILLCAATADFFDIAGTWESFRYAKRLYTRMGLSERVDLLENDAGHNYNQLQREGAARWMSRWLLGKDAAVHEPAITLLTEKEYECTPGGQVMRLAGARSIYDLNEDYENELAGRRAALWNSGDHAGRLGQVRRLAGIRTLSELPRARVEVLGTVARNGYRIERLALLPEEGLWLPALLFLPGKPGTAAPVLYVHDRGKAADAGPGGPIERMVDRGTTVLAVDVRGVGQMQPSVHGGYPQTATEWQDFYIAYLLGRSYVGMRAEDLLVSARYLAERTGERGASGVALVAVGHLGIPALHAAALEPGLFAGVRLVRTLASWSGIVHARVSEDHLIDTVHGALAHYDLPDLAATLGRKLIILESLDSQGRPLAQPR